MQDGANIEAKRHPKIDVVLARFSGAFGNIDGSAAGPRRSREEAASGTLSPADPPGRRHIIKEYCTITSKDGVACGI